MLDLKDRIAESLTFACSRSALWSRTSAAPAEVVRSSPRRSRRRGPTLSRAAQQLSSLDEGLGVRRSYKLRRRSG